MSSDLAIVQVGDPAHPRDVYIRPGSSDESVLKGIFQIGEYNLSILARFPDIQDALQLMADSGTRPLIVDAGANIGLASVFFNIIVPQARIVAIEPAEDNFEILRMNMRGLNGACVKAALASSFGNAKVVGDEAGFWAYRTERTADDEAGVPCVSIGDIYEKELSATVKPFIVKMDIEGFEEDVFSANTEWVDQTPIIMVELHDWLFPNKGTSRSFLRCMAERDRDFIIWGEVVFSMRYNLSE